MSSLTHPLTDFFQSANYLMLAVRLFLYIGLLSLTVNFFPPHFMNTHQFHSMNLTTDRRSETLPCHENEIHLVLLGLISILFDNVTDIY